MERLVFQCPATGRAVDIGIETDIRTLLRIRQSSVHARCPACGNEHEWALRDAFLTQAA